LEFDFKVGKKHQLASCIDSILDGNFDPDEKPSDDEIKERTRTRERAEKIIKSGEELDVLRAVDRARKELTAEDEAARQRRLDEKRAKYQEVESYTKKALYDPLAGLNKTSDSHDSTTTFTPASPEQIEALKELTGEKRIDARRLSAADVEKRIHDLEIRKQYKYASERQLKMMINNLGCDPREARRMRKWDASKWIDARKTELQAELVEHGWSWENAQSLKPWELLPTLNRIAAQQAEFAPKTAPHAPQSAATGVSSPNANAAVLEAFA
jgi:hypothetical protein